jgi:hypothetical protein
MDYERFVQVVVHLDANRVNARGQLQEVNQLERWRDDGVILMQMSRTAQLEATAGGSPRRSSKARSHIFTLTGDLIDSEKRLRDRIEQTLFPAGAATANESNDVDVVFSAAKYDAILVTADGASKTQPRGILGSRSELEALGVTVMTDIEVVAYVRVCHERHREPVGASPTRARVGTAR